MKKNYLKDKNDNVVGISIETEKEVFTIPVVDVRVNRKRAEAFEKSQQTGSKFFKPSCSLLGHRY